MSIFQDKRIKRLLFFVAIMVVLTGCQQAMVNGAIKPGFEITQTSPWNMDTGWFRFLFVIPIGKLIVFLSPLAGPILAMSAATIIVRLLTLPVTLKSTVSSERMKDAQPELNAIADKYKGKTDQASKQQRMVEQQKVYKKYDIQISKMMLGMFMTLPIFLATYQAVQSVPILHDQHPFGMDLVQTLLDGVKVADIRYIVLFILVAISQLVQMKLPAILAKRRVSAAKQHNPNQKDPTASTMNIMMVFIVGISLILPAIMGIYWIVGALFQTCQTLYIHNIYIPKLKAKNKK